MNRPPLSLCLAAALVYGGLFFASVIHPGNSVKLDSMEYLKLSHNLRAHHVFSSSETVPFEPELYRLPGYPLFLAVAGASSPSNVRLALGLQCLMGLLLPILAWPFFFDAGGRRGAILGSCLLSFDLIVVLHHGLILAEPLFLCLLMAALWRSVLYLRSRSRRDAILAGFLWGAATLVKPIAIYAAPALLVSSWRNWKRAAILALCMFFLPSLWVLRNKIVSGKSVYTVQGGAALFTIAAVDVLAMDAGISRQQVLLQMEHLLEQEGVGKGTDPLRRNEVMHRKAVEILKSHPISTAKVCLVGAARILAGTGLEMVIELMGAYLPEVEPGGAELSGQGTRRLLSRYPLLIPLQFAYFFFLLGAYLSFLFGVVRLIREGQMPVAAFLLLSLSVFLAVASHQGYYRFRIPLMPFLAFSAAAAFRRRPPDQGPKAP